jgi:hypothetical protein
VKAVDEQRLQHETDGIGVLPRRNPGDDSKANAIDPRRSSDYAITLDIPGGADEIDQGSVVELVPSAAEESTAWRYGAQVCRGWLAGANLGGFKLRTQFLRWPASATKHTAIVRRLPYMKVVLF